MDVVSGFWSGALQWGRRFDVRELAERAGGWGALERCSAAELRGLGLPARVSERWAAAGSRPTLGCAVTLADARYPARLAQLPDAPPVLFVEGDVDLLDRPSVAVVGTRRCSPYGIGVARHLGSALAEAGQVVVSGLARGIDAHAHEATLGRGPTVAVLGHGLAHTAPPSNRRLRARLVEEGGAVVSAWLDDERPARWTFPVRNRWVAGLCTDVVVVEAPARSGALITAREAAALGREVWVVPGPLGRSEHEGTLRLAAEGAGLITDVSGWVNRHFGAVDPVRGWRALLLAGAGVEELARARGWTVSEMLRELARLELDGQLVRLPGGRYAEGRRSVTCEGCD